MNAGAKSVDVLAVLDALLTEYGYMLRSGTMQITIHFTESEHQRVKDARAAAAALIAERDALQEQVDNLSAAGVHTCGGHCMRPICVLQRENDALRKEAQRYRWLIENCSSNGGLGVEIFIGDDAPDAEELGAAIDAALARAQGVQS